MKISQNIFLLLAFVCSSYAKNTNHNNKGNSQQETKEQIQEEKAAWKFSHKHNRVTKQKESAEQVAVRKWASMGEDVKNDMVRAVKSYKVAVDKSDSEGAESALASLEKVFQYAVQSGDTSTAKVIPHLVAGLKNYTPAEKREVVDSAVDATDLDGDEEPKVSVDEKGNIKNIAAEEEATPEQMEGAFEEFKNSGI